jgi:hypothetical protein
MLLNYFLFLKALKMPNLDKCFEAVKSREQSTRKGKKRLMLLFYNTDVRDKQDARADFALAIKNVGVFNINYFNNLQKYNAFRLKLRENDSTVIRAFKANAFGNYEDFV